jgi:hypothetical protein
VFTNRIAEVDRKRAAYQDLVADGLMEREELRSKLDALSRQKTAAEEELEALEERRSRVRQLEVSREKILAPTSKWLPRSWKRPTGTSVAQCTIPSGSPSGPRRPRLTR